MLALLLACALISGEEESVPVVEEAPPTAADWNAWPPDNQLVPSAEELAVALGEAGLHARVTELAARISHDTDIVLSSLAAMRTGAEIGALLLEAGAAPPEVRSARLGRIAEGFEVMELDTAGVMALRDAGKELEGEAWLERLDGERPALGGLTGQRGDGELPLALAGGWLQALWLVARAAEIEQRPESAHGLLYRPEVDAYFMEYLSKCAAERFPDGTITALDEGMTTIRERAANDPMSADDVRVVRETAEGLLGMM